ncbi:hypothetical protein GY21_13075 [Cryobacterium roopkundense]|uniref:Ig-like domain-containing protein n=1 Tax=Cryobacterium roopkundense TaxID=1001240 RepID=A0A099J396_9MICO|nr:hypothetical protein [Cryobacterium roopkundense]KGJ72791.1 hypothetical protein GY21_13075 [Cryobacterium roopkundense]MBB5639456.1 hypothetical protein [Cryobacterium roopkundense]MBB5643633.1 hypothetical protein [Cryobacterium roopkundense]
MSVRRGIAAGALALLMLGVVGQTAASTTAAWSDPSYHQAQFTTLVVSPPAISTCVLTPGLLGTSPTITLTWRLPAGTSYTTANVRYYVAQGGLLGNLTTVVLGANLSTTEVSAGVYQTQFRSGLLGGLLGGSYGVYLQTVDGSGWTSTLASATASMGLAGASPRCVVAAA